MSGTAVPLPQFAQSLAQAGAGADVSNWVAGIDAGTGQRRLATAFADAPFIEWYGVCGNGGDDTAVFTRAVLSGLPFRLGPKTYIVNGSWSTGAATSFVLRGTPGLSRLLRMQGGTTGAWIDLACAVVDIDGVIFDANAPQVQAATWNVLIDTPVQLARLRRCSFRNNSGALGRGLAVNGNPLTTQSIRIEDCEFSGNSGDGCGLFQVADASVVGCRAFGNGGSGIGVSVIGAPTATVINRRILVQGNRCWNNAVDGINLGTINPTNATPPAYTLGAPSLAIVSVLGNIVWENGSYGIQAYGDWLDVSGNQVSQLGTAQGGIVITARDSRVARNTLDVPGAYIGIDSGGCSDCTIAGNSVTSAAIGINPGGSQRVMVSGNRVTNCHIGISVYDIEADGNGVPFPAPLCALSIEGNAIALAPGQVGVSLLDGGIGVAVVGNRFASTDPSVAASQAMALRSGSVLLTRNSWNGSDRIDLNPGTQNVLEVPDVFDTVRVPSGGEVIDSLLPASVAVTAGQVSYLTLSNGGTGYTQASVTIAGAGTGAQATAMLAGGSVIGFRVTNNGSGYVQGSTSCTISGNGIGAAASVTVGTPLQPNRRLHLLSEQGVTIRQNGQSMTQNSRTQADLVLAANAAVECVESGGSWLLYGF